MKIVSVLDGISIDNRLIRRMDSHDSLHNQVYYRVELKVMRPVDANVRMRVLDCVLAEW